VIPDALGVDNWQSDRFRRRAGSSPWCGRRGRIPQFGETALEIVPGLDAGFQRADLGLLCSAHRKIMALDCRNTQSGRELSQAFFVRHD